MAVFLLDTNVLLALLWPNHECHPAAFQWFTSLGDHHWATCPFTQCAFVRISSNPRFSPEALSPQEAMLVLERRVAHPQHIFLKDVVSPATSSYFPRKLLRGHQQVTDAYLLASCLAHGARLATYDQAVYALTQTQQERDAILLLRA